MRVQYLMHVCALPVPHYLMHVCACVHLLLHSLAHVQPKTKNK